ncbi:MAG: glycosyltransferase N-terminal domain-containing protein [Pseudomonadota bacterium]
MTQGGGRRAMRGRIGLAAYRALSGRSPGLPYAPSRLRPAGPLIWLHAGEPGSGARFAELAQRLCATDPDLRILLTVADDALPKTGTAITTEVLDADRLPDAQAFVAYWRPDLVLWGWGGLRPNHLIAAAETGVPLYLVDGGQNGFDSARERWLPEVSRTVLSRFTRLLVRSEAAQARVLRFGVPPGRVETCPPLLAGAQVLPAAQSDLDELSAAMTGRPVWYADGVTGAEVAHVLEAQRAAQRASYRLLLVIAPADEAADARVVEACAAQGHRLQRWSDGDLPDEATSVLLADLPDEAGLWFRLAPLAFMGGSLSGGGAGRDPLAAAALGAAVLYGPGVGSHLEAYRRLAEAGAARIVSDGASLGTAVTRLIAPDQSARMALAGWDVVTTGAAAMDRIIELSLAELDAAAQGAS